MRDLGKHCFALSVASALLVSPLSLPGVPFPGICAAAAAASPDVAASDRPAAYLTAEVIAKVSPAVVRVIAVRPPKAEDEQPSAGVASATAPASDKGSDKALASIGSGFIIDPAGYIATNKHVIGDAVSIFIATSDGVRYPADLVGMTDAADMALLHVDAGHPLPSVPFGDSDKMQVGDPVIAIGSPFGFDNSVTRGILSAVNRDIMESPFDDYLQTDAAINHGNSGGPLFNMSGEVIGMNSVIFAPGTGSVGLGFALPSNDLHFVFDRLIKTGEIRAGMLPIHTQQVSWMLQQALESPVLSGALVSSIQDEHQTMLEGKIKPGDIILSFNGQKVWDPRDLARKAARAVVGSDAALELDRGGDREIVHVTIHAWPEAKLPSLTHADRKLGLELASTPGADGHPAVTVVGVDPTGSAADSGIQKGDTILEVQRTPVSDPDQALRIFRVQSFNRHAFAAVLVERDKKRSWIPMAVPPNTD